MHTAARTNRPLTIGNLLLEGYEETAARITRKFGARSCNIVVIVDDAGRAFAGREIVMRAEDGDYYLQRLEEVQAALAAANARADRFLKAAQGVETWWLEQGMHEAGGAPHAIFALREVLAISAPPASKATST